MSVEALVQQFPWLSACLEIGLGLCEWSVLGGPIPEPGRMVGLRELMGGAIERSE